MKRLTRLLKTSTFRLSVVYLALFVLSVSAVLAYIYLNTSVLLAHQTDETIDAEITGLAEQYRSGGLDRLVQVVAARSQAGTGGVYLLTTGEGRRLAGNIGSAPEGQPGADWIEFTYRVAGHDGEELRAALARQFRLAGDFRLLVGRDIGALRRFEHLIRTTLVWALGLTVLLGLIGGLLISRGFLQRIEEITATSRTIVGGDLTGRVAVSGSGDEIDRLADSLNDMLDEIERLMGVTRQVTDNIAHDLRTPLSRMRARIEDVLRVNGGGGAYREILQQTLDDSDRLIVTFNALLSIARIEAGAGRATLSEINVATTLTDAAELYEPLAEERGIAFSIDVEPDLAARADRQILGQALANLIDNAMKYAGDGTAGGDDHHPSIAIAGRRAGRFVEIVVADNGPGIAEADRERVFGRFVRLERSRTAPGSGLGLALVAAVARHHGGTVRLEDNGPGLRAVLTVPAAG